MMHKEGGMGERQKTKDIEEIGEMEGGKEIWKT